MDLRMHTISGRRTMIRQMRKRETVKVKTVMKTKRVTVAAEVIGRKRKTRKTRKTRKIRKIRKTRKTRKTRKLRKQQRSPLVHALFGLKL